MAIGHLVGAQIMKLPSAMASTTPMTKAMMPRARKPLCCFGLSCYDTPIGCVGTSQSPDALQARDQGGGWLSSLPVHHPGVVRDAADGHAQRHHPHHDPEWDEHPQD